MKSKNLMLGLKSIALVLIMGLFACEGDLGPQGPQGPLGPQGPQGIAGVNGQDGQNGAENCVDCHGNNQLITAKVFQWENSVHAIGGHYTINRSTCAGCHTSQGFLDRIATGGQTASADVDDPLPQNCYTCHQIHTTYTYDDWAPTYGDPVTLWVGGETVDVGKGNQCIICHQPRVREPFPTPGQTGMLEVTTSRYGPHHGAQGALFTGSGAYEVGSGYANSSHTELVQDACITCHMAPVLDGREAGGHTFRVETADGELNTNGCVQCHTDEDALMNLVNATQSGIAELLQELAVELREAGILEESRDRSIPGTYPPDVVGAMWNYMYVLEDQSMGVHNANYARTLLQNSIAALQ
jgi:formate-dependent nitrite reductase cytochrome c552 subunit